MALRPGAGRTGGGTVLQPLPGAGCRRLGGLRPAPLPGRIRTGHVPHRPAVGPGHGRRPGGAPGGRTARGAALGGLFELFLRLARAGAVALLPESLYRVRPQAAEDAHRRHFDYLLPEHRARQLELERIFTAHLRALGAWLPQPAAPLPEPAGAFPVEASVVIPVRNRVRTIGEALASAATQQCPFPFNVLVVDNHSTDGTAEAIEAARSRSPASSGWSRRRPGPASAAAGSWRSSSRRCAAATPSSSTRTTSTTDRTPCGAWSECLRDGRAALAVGTYRLVDRELREIPPGVIDHREWTAGERAQQPAAGGGASGAPRAFHVPASGSRLPQRELRRGLRRGLGAEPASGRWAASSSRCTCAGAGRATPTAGCPACSRPVITSTRTPSVPTRSGSDNRCQRHKPNIEHRTSNAERRTKTAWIRIMAGPRSEFGVQRSLFSVRIASVFSVALW